MIVHVHLYMSTLKERSKKHLILIGLYHLKSIYWDNGFFFWRMSKVLEDLYSIIAILQYFPLILLSENFPSCTTFFSGVRWKIIANH
jgi:hypothetical protein